MLVDGTVEGVGAPGLQLARGRHAAGNAVQPHERSQLALHIGHILPIPPAQALPSKTKFISTL